MTKLELLDLMGGGTYYLCVRSIILFICRAWAIFRSCSHLGGGLAVGTLDVSRMSSIRVIHLNLALRKALRGVRVPYRLEFAIHPVHALVDAGVLGDWDDRR